MRAPVDGGAPSVRRLHRLSLLWRVFAANTIVFVAAVAILAWTPITVHRVATWSEVVVLFIGLLIMLAVDLVLLRRTFGPLRRLAGTMSAVDPDQPGRRAETPESAGGEVLALSGALNSMLDRLEGERRDSARRILAAQEQERVRIARELHDEVGQTLTAIALRAERAAVQPGETSAALAEIAHIAHRSLEDVRRIGRELRPEALDDLGLVNALIALCTRIDQQAGLQVRRELEWQLPPLSPDVELVIYRTAQEAITNVLRHSKAARASIALHAEGAWVVLEVSDDGQGLPDTRTESGLRGLRERARLIDAQLLIDSGGGAGTRILLRVPVPR